MSYFNEGPRDDYFEGSGSLDDGSEYDDGVNEFYLGDSDEEYPRGQ